MKFLFDLDGTVTSKETLPIIAEHFGVQDQIAELTHHTVQGNVPFVESFIRRVNILGRFFCIRNLRSSCSSTIISISKQIY